MKKTIIVFAAITFLISCGDKKKTTTDNSSTTETNTTISIMILKKPATFLSMENPLLVE